MTEKQSFLTKASAALGQWQKKIITKHKTNVNKEEIPHPAASPISTDQEAGGSSTTPEGIILHDEDKPD